MPDGRSLHLVFVVALVVLASVGIVGSVWFVESHDATPGPVVADDAADRLAEIEDVSATRETVIEREDGTNKTVENVTLRPQTGEVRAIQLEGPRQTDVRVSNGSVLWLYDEEKATVQVLDHQDPDGPAAVDIQRLDRLLTQLHEATSGEPAPTREITPLPAVPAESSTNATGPVGVSGPYNMSYEGKEEIDGRTTHVVELTLAGTGEPVANYTQTLWLDAERYYPLQQRTAWIQGGERTTITTTYRNVSFDPGIDDGVFEFDPPADTTVERSETADQQQYDSLSALRADATMTVPEPDVPESFMLVEATRTDARIGSVGLQYVNATATLSVAKLDSVVPATTDGAAVTIDGKEGTYRDLGPTQSVVWNCDGNQYKVRGSGLPRATLLSVAESVSCS